MTSVTDSYQKEIVLELEEGSEHKLQINTDISMTTDIMYPVFHAAEVAVAGIIRSSEQFSSKNYTNNDLYGYANNIIAFSGKRGQGKTSAMLSFSGALGQYDKSKFKRLSLSQAEQFYILDPIDPSMLQEDSALNVILSRLYQIARRAIKKQRTSEDGYATAKIALEQSSRNMIVQFQRCLSGVRALSGPSPALDMDDFENLVHLVDGLHLKTELYNLVQSFLHIMGMDARSGYIVIQLDDTDLQLKNAYNVLDDICKYLTLPNVIILMATDMEQLQILVEQHYMEELKVSFDSMLVDKEMLQGMAIKYLDKLIPVSQVIRLPSLNTSFESSKPLQIKVVRNGKVVGPIEDIQKKFLTMIYEKTGIAFVKNSAGMHSIMPTTLRSLRHFYRFLNETLEDCGKRPYVFDQRLHDAQDYQRYKEQYRAWIARREQNLTFFENYFLDDWCSGHLSQENKSILRAISEAPLGQTIRQSEAFLNTLELPESLAEDEESCSLFHKIGALARSANQFKYSNLAAGIKTILSIQLQRISLKDRMASLEAWDGSTKLQPKFITLKKSIDHLRTRSGSDAKSIWIDPEKSTLNVFSLFMEGLEPATKGEDSNDIIIAEEYQNYAVAVCCNLDPQEYIESYIENHSDALPREGQHDFVGNVVEYYEHLMTSLTERCEYLYQEQNGESIFKNGHSTHFLLPRGITATIKNLDSTTALIADSTISNCIGGLDSLINMISALQQPGDFGPDISDVVENVMRDIVMLDEFDVDSEVVDKCINIMSIAEDIAFDGKATKQRVNGLRTRLKNLRKLLVNLFQLRD